MSRSGGTTLYVTGFSSGTRARDLAYEFERYSAFCSSPSVDRPFDSPFLSLLVLLLL